MLLDALTGLQAHINAVVIVGAQAVYMRTAGRLSTYQAYTTDADLVVDPDELSDTPPLGDAMTTQDSNTRVSQVSGSEAFGALDSTTT